MVLDAILIAGITFAGIFIACKGFGYEISPARMLGAAVCFAVLEAVPFSSLFSGSLRYMYRAGWVLEILVPAVGLYICLMDDTFNRDMVKKVFALSYLFAAFGIFIT